MKTVIVGGVAGGGSAAARYKLVIVHDLRLKRLDESANITIFEKGPYNAFANCGLPFYVGGIIPKVCVSSVK